MKRFSKIFFLLLSITTIACRNNNVQSVTVTEYLKMLNNPDNGLVVTKKVNGLNISMKYLPAGYLVYKEQKEQSFNKAQADSIEKAYANSLTFLLTFSPDETKGNETDVMFDGLKNYKEYVERDLAMNFDMEQKVILRAGKKAYKPVLSSMENIYSLNNGRSIILVFVPTDNKEEFNKMDDVDLTYTDDLFNVGILHFNFLTTNFTKLPQINFN
jgi:hypothetical protein